MIGDWARRAITSEIITPSSNSFGQAFSRAETCDCSILRSYNRGLLHKARRYTLICRDKFARPPPFLSPGIGEKRSEKSKEKEQKASSEKIEFAKIDVAVKL